MTSFDETLLAILVCPLTRTELRYDAGRRELVSDAAGLAYPVRGGIPVMLAEEARRLVPPHAAHGEGDQPQAGGGVRGSRPEDPAQVG